MAKNVARFEKVTFEEFSSAMRNHYTEKDFSDMELHMMYDSIELPKRATSGSVGYDFNIPFDVTIVPGSQIFVPTGIRCVFLKDEWGLFMMPKSRNVKTSIRLSNTIGVIDTDYYKADNSGHIMIFLEFPANPPYTQDITSVFNKHTHKHRLPYHYNVGDGFVQGIFHEIGLVEGEDIPEDDRTGGFGSTDESKEPVDDMESKKEDGRSLE